MCADVGIYHTFVERTVSNFCVIAEEICHQTSRETEARIHSDHH